METFTLRLFFLSIYLVSPALSQATLPTETAQMESSICQNNGTSKNKRCQCIAPWTGENCTEYACVHGLSVGSQFHQNSIFFNKRCICEAGFTGDLCDVPLINPCGVHGNLVDEKCACHVNYTGSKCEHVKFCLHGQLSSGRCNCNYGWSSDFCSHIICHQGISDENNSNCTCRSGYRGTFCDLCDESQSETTPYPECVVIKTSRFYESKQFIIASAAILAVMFISCLIVCLVLRKKRNQRLQRRRNDPVENNLRRPMGRMESDDEIDFL